jgi:hypothetical protein
VGICNSWAGLLDFIVVKRRMVIWWLAVIMLAQGVTFMAMLCWVVIMFTLVACFIGGRDFMAGKVICEALAGNLILIYIMTWVVGRAGTHWIVSWSHWRLVIILFIQVTIWPWLWLCEAGLVRAGDVGVLCGTVGGGEGGRPDGSGQVSHYCGGLAIRGNFGSSS